jgi:hypothetical protein
MPEMGAVVASSGRPSHGLPQAKSVRRDEVKSGVAAVLGGHGEAPFGGERGCGAAWRERFRGGPSAHRFVAHHGESPGRAFFPMAPMSISSFRPGLAAEDACVPGGDVQSSGGGTGLLPGGEGFFVAGTQASGRMSARHGRRAASLRMRSGAPLQQEQQPFIRRGPRPRLDDRASSSRTRTPRGQGPRFLVRRTPVIRIEERAPSWMEARSFHARTPLPRRKRCGPPREGARSSR